MHEAGKIYFTQTSVAARILALMRTVRTCIECHYRHDGSTSRQLMNKIIMWNHVKKEHPQTAQRIMRMYGAAPDSLYSTISAGSATEGASS